MAEIHIMPMQLRADRDTQTVTTLMRAIDSGVDLGARGHHIQALSLSLECTSRMLQQATAALPTGSGPQAADWQSVRSDIAELMRLIEHLNLLCRTLPM